MAQDEVFEYGYRNGRQLKHFLVDVTGAGAAHLLRALTIAFSDVVGGGAGDERLALATHLLRDEARQLTFFQARGELRRPPFHRSGFDALVDHATAFAAPIGPQQAAHLAWDWLQQLQYPSDEHDGASFKGWRVFNQQFGIVGGHWDAFVAVRPMWIYLPK